MKVTPAGQGYSDCGCNYATPQLQPYPSGTLPSRHGRVPVGRIGGRRPTRCERRSRLATKLECTSPEWLQPLSICSGVLKDLASGTRPRYFPAELHTFPVASLWLLATSTERQSHRRSRESIRTKGAADRGSTTFLNVRSGPSEGSSRSHRTCVLGRVVQSLSLAVLITQRSVRGRLLYGHVLEASAGSAMEMNYHRQHILARSSVGWRRHANLLVPDRAVLNLFVLCSSNSASSSWNRSITVRMDWILGDILGTQQHR